MSERVGGWLDGWSTRHPISVPHTVSPSGANDVAVAIPKWHPIWAVLTSEGSTDSVRVTAGDGYTELTYQLTDSTFLGAWSTATKDGGIKINDAPFIDTTTVGLLWVYYGNSSSSDGQGSVALSSEETGYLYSGIPHNSLLRVDGNRTPPGVTLVPVERAKTSDETVFFYVRLNRVRARNAYSVDGYRGFEAPFGATYTIDEAGSPASATFDVSAQRFVETERGDLLLLVLAKAGSDGTDYTAIVTVVTGFDQSSVNNTKQTIEAARFLIKVNDPDET